MLTFALYCYLACGAILCAFLFTLCAMPLIGIFQQLGYLEQNFIKWYYRKNNLFSRRVSLLTLALFLLVTLFNVCFCFAGAQIANLISVLPFAGVCALYVYAQKRALKVPLKRTGRVTRLTVCYFILTAAVVFGLGIGLSFAAEAISHEAAYLLRYAAITLVPLLFPLLLAGAGFVMRAFEIPRNRHFIKKAQIALDNSSCIKVGITGSFGKTSVKNYAAKILSQKFNVIVTPSSFNTPIGIARTVNEAGLNCDIFLAEMGARHTGDIKELCDMVKPTVGVVTGVCNQHIQTFGSLENIKAEKGVLASYCKQSVLGATACEMQAADALKEGEDFAVENIRLSERGTSFTLRIKAERAEVNSSLLGRHAAEDIALAAALAYRLGMSIDEIVQGIERIEPVPHRLQLIEANGLHILDDSYNSNTEGAKNALEVLRLFEGKKVVVTPGIVELGELEEEENKKLGAALVGLNVILVGETLALAVKRGYLEAGGSEEEIHIVPTLEKAQEVLQKELAQGDSVLFLNDLPDIY